MKRIEIKIRKEREVSYWWTGFSLIQRIVLVIPYIIAFLYLYFTESEVEIVLPKRIKKKKIWL